jgi:hypothetical protein
MLDLILPSGRRIFVILLRVRCGTHPGIRGITQIRRAFVGHRTGLLRSDFTSDQIGPMHPIGSGNRTPLGRKL